jgi:hypothetical protein
VASIHLVHELWPKRYLSIGILVSVYGISRKFLPVTLNQGMVWSGTQYPRDTLSKGCNIQENSVRDTVVGYEFTLHPKR